MVAQRSRAGFPRTGWLPVALAVAVLAFFTSAPASAQTWNGGTDNSWFTGTNWSGDAAPNSAGAVVTIANATNNPVQLNSQAEVSTLSMGTGTSLDLNAGFIVAGGSISNAGSITGSSELRLANNLTLSGAGTLTLAGGQIGTDGNGRTLTNQSTINGFGLIGSDAGIDFPNLSLNNSGTIDANSSGNTLTIGGTGGSFTNSGTFEATGGGTLQLSTPAPINNNGGLVLASGSGSTVNVSSSIQGGTITTNGGGVVQSSGTGELDGSSNGAITISDGSTYTAGGSSNTKIQGTLNLGTSTGGTLALSNTLELVNNTTLSGPGSVVMTGGQIGTDGNGRTLTNSAGTTIQGFGLIGSDDAADFPNLSLTNNGTVNANSSGNTLTIGGTGGSIVNNSLFEATNGGTLSLASNAPVQNFGTITAGPGSTVDMSTDIVGGTLTTVGTGVMQTTAGGATLDASSLGAITLSDGSTYTATAGTTKIQGTLNLGTSTGSTLALGGALELINNTTLSGPGVVNMTGNGSNSTGGQIGTNSNGYTLTNNVTIQGSGTIGSNNTTWENLSLLNNGTIDANTSGAANTLSIQGDGGSIVNAGTFEATNGGTLNLATSAPINNNNGVTAGTITAGTGSTVNISTTILGGTLTTVGTGVMQTTAAGAYLNGGASQGAITLSNGSTYTSTAGTTDINGLLNLGTGGGASLTLGGALELVGNTTLSGAGGVVNISGNGTNSQGGQIGTNGNGYTLTNSAGVTIQGSGTIGSNNTTFQNLSLINNGTIDANTTAATLSIQGDGGTIMNNNVFEATNSGILNVDPVNPVNNSGGSIIASGAGSVVNLTNAIIQGGTLTTTGGGLMQTVGLTTLDGLSQGALTLSNGSTLLSSIANGNQTNVKGTLNLGTGGGATLTLSNALELVNNTTLQGAGGVVNISGDAAASSGGQIGTNGNGYTLTNDVTIQGTGTIGSNNTTFQNLSLTNNGTIDANTTGQVLSVQGTGTVINNSVFESTNGGTLNLATSNPLNNSGGSITASGAGSTVDISNTRIEGGTLNNNTGGVMQTVGLSTLDGNSLGAITLSNGSTLTSSIAGGLQTDILGTLNLGTGGGATLTLSNALELVNNTTLSGAGGVVNISGTATGANTGTGGQIGTNGNGYTLTNDVTIQGTGVIGSNSTTDPNLNLINNGTINANQSGGILAIGSTGSVTNNSLFEATNGGILNLGTSNPINNGSGNITASGAGSTVNVNTTIDGGTLNTNGGGVMQTGASGATLNGSTAAGAVTISDGSTYTSGAGAFTKVLGTINLGTSTGGTLSLGGDLQLVNNTTLSGPGALVMTGNPIPENSAQGAQIGTNGNGYTLTNQTTIEGSGLIGSNVGALDQNLTVVNGANGTILANAGNPLVVGGSGSLTNNGTLQANTGSTLIVTNTLTNFAGTTLTGGTYNANGGTIQLNLPPNTSGGEIVTDAGNIILNGASAAINDGGNHNALSDLATIAASNGSLSLLGGAQLTTSAANFANNGTLTIGSGSTLNTNNFAQGATGTLNEQVTGTAAGQFGLTNVSGTATLAGGSTLDVNWGDFDAGTSDDYMITFLDAADGLTGTYSNVDLNCPVNDTCSVGYTADTAFLGIDGPAAPPPPPPPPPPPATPEPSTFVMMASGLASLAAGMKMRKGRRNAKD